MMTRRPTGARRNAKTFYLIRFNPADPLQPTSDECSLPSGGDCGVDGRVEFLSDGEIILKEPGGL